ncbi:hypothetical protein L226DRAFT_533516 [Lentinus tigrinus ALCF2SS1-7]|uniref:uncharacterized protein n=1 Tax=Lentinus tigrinus ALCF2SS1-7 TaxID=1328758 RepID=UPI001166180A|nr:hypothetical protein L226DRAFT_533516 [Lentinus tigrinus ALCF2SS1-7]
MHKHKRQHEGIRQADMKKCSLRYTTTVMTGRLGNGNADTEGDPRQIAMVCTSGPGASSDRIYAPTLRSCESTDVRNVSPSSPTPAAWMPDVERAKASSCALIVRPGSSASAMRHGRERCRVADGWSEGSATNLRLEASRKTFSQPMSEDWEPSHAHEERLGTTSSPSRVRSERFGGRVGWKRWR